MLAANLAGKAINIAKTTAAHAMSYKLTSIFGIAHGHAVSVCLPLTWKHIIDNYEKCIDPRGGAYLGGILQEIALSMGGKKVREGLELFNKLVEEFNLESPQVKVEQLESLSLSVNVERLNNNPVRLTVEDIYALYQKLIAQEK